jgi:hypothetical protein
MIQFNTAVLGLRVLPNFDELFIFVKLHFLCCDSQIGLLKKPYKNNFQKNYAVAPYLLLVLTQIVAGIHRISAFF